jgi:hypothetical protein
MPDGVEADGHAGVGERAYIIDAHCRQRGSRLELSNERVGAARPCNLLERSAGMANPPACFLEPELFS